MEHEDIERELRTVEAYREWRNQPSPDRLFYYTSLKTGIEILSEGKIWATSVRRMQDSSELLHGSRFLKRAMSEAGDGLDGDAVDPYWVYSRGLGSDARPARGLYDIYALCLSTRPDDAHQWERYGSGGWGLSLEFPRNQLGVAERGRGTPSAGPPNAEEPWLKFREENEKLRVGPVIYKPSRKRRMINQLVQRAAELASTLERGKVNRALRQVAGEVLPFFKGASYQDEKEWRICALGLVGASQDQLEFRSDRGLIHPYLEVAFTPPASRERTQQIPAKVYAGPGLTPTIHERSLHLLASRASDTTGNVEPIEIDWVNNEDVSPVGSRGAG